MRAARSIILWTCLIVGTPFVLFFAVTFVDWMACARLPSGTDPQLAGTWISTDYNPSMTLNADGSGVHFTESGLNRPLEWSASAGHFYTKHNSTDATVVTDELYTFSDGGNTLHLQDAENERIRPTTMKRLKLND